MNISSATGRLLLVLIALGCCSIGEVSPAGVVPYLPSNPGSDAADYLASGGTGYYPQRVFGQDDNSSLAVDRVVICHKGRTIVVAEPAVAAHLEHGDTLGPCGAALGRCCQGGFAGNVCLVNTEEECMSSGQFISWTEGEGCPNGDATCDEAPLGRCCFQGIVPEPLLCEVTTEEQCLRFAAPVSWTEGEDCAGDPCNQADAFAGCGVLALGPQGCIVLNSDSGEMFAVSNLGGFTVGDRVWVSGTIDPDSLACFPFVLPEIVNNTIGACFEGCGTLVQGVECVLFQADAGGLYFLFNLGGFQVGDRVEVVGCLNPTCFTICLEGDGCIEDNTIQACVEPLGRCCQGGFAGNVCLVNTEAECMSSGQFISWTEGEGCPNGDATCDPAPLGRCCQGGFAGNVCLVNTEAECMSSGQFICWVEGEDCPAGTNPCEPLLGRCCQGGFVGTVCLVNTEAECMSSGQFISWTACEGCPNGDDTCNMP